MKTAKQLERHFKGLANHYRINIMFLVSKSPGITVEGITKSLHANFKTISVHMDITYRNRTPSLDGFANLGHLSQEICSP